MTPEIHHGDMRAVLDFIPDSTFHACITDPPYHLTSTVKRFGADGAAPAKPGVYGRSSAGFMGKKWDGGDISFRPETWAEVLRVLKPGAYLLCFGGTRTWHRIACAIEDAGFDIRDTIMWLYAKGFPKSHDVARGIDKHLGVRGVLGEPRSAAHAEWIARGALRGDQGAEGWQRPWMDDPEQVAANARRYIAGSPQAAPWQGWGSALKPAWEPIIVARRPLVGTIAENVLAHGCGGFNIDACRIGEHGRWPANVAHDGSDEVEAAFAAFGEKRSGTGARKAASGAGYAPNALGSESRPAGTPNVEYGDVGSASRFFFSGKATAADRAGSKHPTVKPVALMRWLVRMVTPPGGLVLDPFAGSGTTGAAARAEGASCVLVEADDEYAADLRRRFAA